MKKASKKKEVFGLHPMGDRLILKEVSDKEANSSGIYIPDILREDRGAKRGRVIAAGEGKFEDGKVQPMRIKVGDMVLYQWGDVITYDGEDYFVVREGDIIGIIK